MVDQLLHTRVQRNLNILARLPFGRVAESVERPDDTKEGVTCGLADAIVVVTELSDELDRALLDIRQEVAFRGREQSADCVCGDLFLDADRAVDVKNPVDIDVEFLVGAIYANGSRRA